MMQAPDLWNRHNRSARRWFDFTLDRALLFSDRCVRGQDANRARGRVWLVWDHRSADQNPHPPASDSGLSSPGECPTPGQSAARPFPLPKRQNRIHHSHPELVPYPRPPPAPSQEGPYLKPSRSQSGRLAVVVAEEYLLAFTSLGVVRLYCHVSVTSNRLDDLFGMNRRCSRARSQLPLLTLVSVKKRDDFVR